MSGDPQDTSDAFRASLELPFPVVGSLDTARAWGVRWPLLGRVRRVSFVVGRDRRVTHRYTHELDFEAHVTEALRALVTVGR